VKVSKLKTVEIVLYSRYSEKTAEFIRQHLKTDAQLNISGALDCLSDEQLQEMAADPVAKGVPVLLNDDNWLYVDHHQIDLHARRTIDTLQSNGADTIMMCCTLPWHSLEPLSGVICPSRVLEANATALLPKGGCLGIVQPDSITKDEEIKHWQALGVPLVRASISPQENTLDELAKVTRELTDKGADIIVLDCLAFTHEHWQRVREVTGKPVILPLSLMGRVLDEAYGAF
jgi:protein AroM